MKAFFRVSGDLELVPHNPETQKYMLNRKEGEVIVAEIKRARNYENHKRFFSFIDATFDIQRHFDTPEAYRRWLTMKCGYFSTIVAPNGNTIFVADSIAFENMEEDEFKKLFSTAIDVFLKELGKGVSEQELMRVIDYD